jgi:hypothetical protein
MPRAWLETASFEDLLHYLRLQDPLGYMTTVGLPPEAASAWALLWSWVRYVDDPCDEGGVAEATVDHAVRQIHDRLAGLYPRLEPELQELGRLTGLEAELYRRGEVRGVDEYFHLLYYKGFLPAYLCGVISLPGETRESLRTFGIYLGYGGTILDDTLDLIADLRLGRFLITREELDFLGLSRASIAEPDGLRKLTRLRNQWALFYYLGAWRATGLFSPENRRLARSWLGLGLRLLMDGRVAPLPPEVLNDRRRFLEHLGAYATLLDFPFPSEIWRYDFLHAALDHLVHTTSFADAESARELYEKSETALPEKLKIEHVVEQGWKPLPLPPWIPEERRTLQLIHYGPGGALRTAFGFVESLFEPRQGS